MQTNEHPFLETVTRHRALIDKICRSFCGSNREDCEDLRQDILLNLWRGWKHWKPEHKPITWIYRVAKNTAISWHRNKQRQIEIQPLETSDIPYQSENKEAVEQLYSLIGQLPSSDQRLIHLYIEGWNGNELAKMMQTSESNITTRISRIKKKLEDLNRKEQI
ncbi:MAG: RNA polymerase sigma factor [Bacteroidales bacterium]|nr:RNA polymerase sigma factor [Bacteroidales bacterium]